jgi:hypothetical protein
LDGVHGLNGLHRLIGLDGVLSHAGSMREPPLRLRGFMKKRNNIS